MSSQTPDVPDTRTRILESSAELMRLQGYNATGIKQIATRAKAPFGSVYHHFPGGKEELGAQAIIVSGASYLELIPAVFDSAPDLETGIRWFYAGAAQHLVETDFEDACPIATIALEVSSVSEPLREACAEVFGSWLAAGIDRYERFGLSAERARSLTLATILALEGAFVLARTLRTTEPLDVACESVLALLAAE